MKCLVTGATGFVGRALCERLNTKGVDFIATSRGGGVLANGQPVRPLDLEIHGVESQWLAGIDVVFHLGGIAHQSEAASTYEAVNYRATVDLAAAAEVAGVKCFVFLSSVKAMGPALESGPRNEDHCVRTSDPYGHSKRRAELDLKAAYQGSEMSVIVLRPALIYGADAAGNLLLLARAARAGIPRPPEMGGRSMIALDDMTALLARLIQARHDGFHLWIVCDGHSYSAGKIYDLMRRALGKESSRDWLPQWTWRWSCALRDLAGNNKLGTTYAKIFGSETYSNAKLLASVDWRPAFALEDVVEQMMSTVGTRS